MNRITTLNTILVICISTALTAQYSWSDHKEETGSVSQIFKVEKMTCAACPLTVKKAMSAVEGVQSIVVNFKAKTVTAVFDPTLVDANAIAQASTAVGFPAHAHGELQ